MEPLKPDEIFCVYCLKVKPKPAKGEHIILNGLGGRATIRDVCGACNQKLGDEIDIEVLRNSFIALHRFHDPKVVKGQVGGTQILRTVFGEHYDCKMFNSGVPKILPQVALPEQGAIVAADHDEKPAVDALLLSLKGLDTLFKEFVRDIDENYPPRVVLNLSKKGSHLVRGRTQADADRVKDVVKAGITAHQRVPVGEEAIEDQMQVKISMEFNITSRCAAKMAFNMATAIFGAKAMVEPAFHPVRAYILGTDVIVKPLRTDAEGRIFAELDERYVDNWINERSHEVVGSTTEHTIQLYDRDGQLGAKVALIGGVEKFHVRLGPLNDLDVGRLPATLVRRDDEDYWCVGSQLVRNGYLKGLDPDIHVALSRLSGWQNN